MIKNSFIISDEKPFGLPKFKNGVSSIGAFSDYYDGNNIIYADIKRNELSHSKTNGGFQLETESINQGSSTKQNFEIQVSKCTSRLIELTCSEDYIEGEISKTQIYMEFLYDKNQDLFQESFQRTWVQLYRMNDQHVKNFINFASTIEYEWLGNKADAMIMGVCSLENELIFEAAIRAVESWGEKSFIPVLERMRKFDADWVEEYKEAVIGYLRSL